MTEENELALQLYAEGFSAKEVAGKTGMRPESVRRLAHEHGITRGAQAPGNGAATDGGDPEDTVLPPGPVAAGVSSVVLTRRCRNKQCLNRYVPVNSHHMHCGDTACNTAEDKWSIEQILSEEAGLAPGTNALNLAKAAFGQKNVAVRENARLRELREYMAYEIHQMHEEHPELRLSVQEYVEPRPSWPPRNVNKGEREIVLLLSDWQVGKFEQGIGVDVATNRIKQTVAATASIIQHFRDSGYTIRKTRVVFAGDMVEGCYIYGGQNVSGLDRTGNTHRLTRQIATAAELEAYVVARLAMASPLVEVDSVPGNHGRTNGKNDFSDPLDNFDTLVAEWAKDKCANISNVAWNIHENWFGSFTTSGLKAVAMHGDAWSGPLQKVDSLLPQWNQSKVFGTPPDLLLLGHRHDFAHFKVGPAHVIQNGTVDGGSLWYTRAYGRASDPAQTVIVTSESHGVETVYTIGF